MHNLENTLYLLMWMGANMEYYSPRFMQEVIN